MNKYIKFVKDKLFYRHGHLVRLSDQELLGLIRHEAHRLEKSVYNNILHAKRDYYDRKYQMIKTITEMLIQRNPEYINHSTIVWSQRIISAYPDILESYVAPFSRAVTKEHVYGIDTLEELMTTRRSCRVWDDAQPSNNELAALAKRLINIGIYAPNSGNRQPWKFAVLIEEQERMVLKGLKERHCYSAPLLIFVGIDNRLYKPAEHLENCLFIDASAAATQIILAAHMLGYGTCWNHLGLDLINSREINKQSYSHLCAMKHIDKNVTPVAILAIGKPKFFPPVPSRVSVEDVLLK